jgi:hypothetical protein
MSHSPGSGYSPVIKIKYLAVSGVRNAPNLEAIPSRATAGVSKWLFVGQISASIGFSIYSYRLHYWVFLVSNLAMIVTELIGECIDASVRRRVQW